MRAGWRPGRGRSLRDPGRYGRPPCRPVPTDSPRASPSRQGTRPAIPIRRATRKPAPTDNPPRPTTHLMSPVRQPARKPIPFAGPRASPLRSSAPPQVIHKFDFLTNPPCAPVPVPVISFLRKRAPHTARSSSGSGRRPLKAEITSSNLVRATKRSTRVARPGFFVVNPSARYRLSRLKGRLLCIEPRPGNTTVPTPSGRRPTPTRSRSTTQVPTRSLPPLPPPPEVGRPPRSPPHSKPAGCPIPHAKPTALIPHSKPAGGPSPREAEAPDCFDAEGESPRPAPADQRMDRDGASARSRYASPPDAN